MRLSSPRSCTRGPWPTISGSVSISLPRNPPPPKRRGHSKSGRGGTKPREEAAMVIRITWGKLRAGAWQDFERTYRENVLTKGKALKGLRGRWLAQDAADKDTGFAVSLWDSAADMEAYEQSPLYREIMAPLQPFLVGEYKTYRCDVKYTDVGA